MKKLNRILKPGLLVIFELCFIHLSQTFFLYFCKPLANPAISRRTTGWKEPFLEHKLSVITEPTAREALASSWERVFLGSRVDFHVLMKKKKRRETAHERVKERGGKKKNKTEGCNCNIRIVKKSAGLCNVCETEWEHGFLLFFYFIWRKTESSNTSSLITVWIMRSIKRLTTLKET